ncbi:uncharacterized protein TRIADDRAFT_52567 [Trichoplax adhaerens]|uniref:Ubiquitin-like domain-containing protein n=1 Tax=Trichoplax adhaerens TaxID=10228 RepID=B3RJ46_TRIAD|nr:hypothetical protein TRIADDRAFT_52567 [Trichoplax adhaerens]EDV29059.1 hypothetical protein TRIADDRAFT_52567 [Trichoplax adhaerens]|eukprot:XP_002108261.1 hypothetical protein TRIADDRAFT_52567 [Trichoplax adhaerens]
MASWIQTDIDEEVDSIYSQIYISLPTREVITLYNVPNQVTILHLKSMIELYSGIPPNVQILQYLTTTDLQDYRTLVSYGIKTRDQLTLTFPVTWTSLFFATWYGDIQEVFFSGVTLTDQYRYTDEEITMLNRIIATRSFFAVMLSARQGHVELIKQLHKNGADMSCCSQFGRNPLHIAAWHGHIDCVDFLLQVNCPILSYDLNGKTPMQLATQRHQDECQRRIWLHIWNSRSQLIRARKQTTDDSKTIHSQITMIEEFITGPSVGNTELDYEKTLLSRWYDPFSRDRDEIVLRLNNVAIDDHMDRRINHKKLNRVKVKFDEANTANNAGKTRRQVISFEQLPATYPILSHDISSRQQIGIRSKNSNKFERWFIAKKRQVQYTLECCIDWNGQRKHEDVDLTFEEWLEMNKSYSTTGRDLNRSNSNAPYTYDLELEDIRSERDYDPVVFAEWLERIRSKERKEIEHQTVQRITAIKRNRGMTFSQLSEVKKKRDRARIMILEEIIDRAPTMNPKQTENHNRNQISFEEWLKRKELEYKLKQYRSAWAKLRKKHDDKRNYSASKQSYDQWLSNKLFQEREQRRNIEKERIRTDQFEVKKDLEKKIEAEQKLVRWRQQKLQLKQRDIIKRKQDEIRQQELREQALAKRKNIAFDQWFDKSIEDEITEIIDAKKHGKPIKRESNTIIQI